MITLNGKNICECCFEENNQNAKKCMFCNGPENLAKYPTSLKEGTILSGRYVVGKVLGKGGFGITYLSYDSQLSKKVAIKEYLPNSLTFRTAGTTIVSTYGGESEEYFRQGAQRFFDEAKLVSNFNGNPNIISVYEFFVDNNTAYYVMEYLDGSDLKHYVADNGGKLSQGEAMNVAMHMADALMIVHSQGTLHRDIAPDNIFVLSDGTVRLIDFGAARQVLGEASKSLSVILKQGFAPMEQYQKKGKQGPWTDIYALGATIYYTVTGEVIDDAMSRLEDESLNLEGIDENFAIVLQKMLKVKSSERYQNAFELKQALVDSNVEPQTLEIKQLPTKTDDEKKDEEKNYPNEINSLKTDRKVNSEDYNKENENDKSKNKTSIKEIFPIAFSIISLLLTLILLLVGSNGIKITSTIWIIALALNIASIIGFALTAIVKKEKNMMKPLIVSSGLILFAVLIVSITQSKIYSQMAEYYLGKGDYSQSINCYMRAGAEEDAASLARVAGVYAKLTNNNSKAELILQAPEIDGYRITSDTKDFQDSILCNVYVYSTSLATVTFDKKDSCMPGMYTVKIKLYNSQKKVISENTFLIEI